MNPSEKHHILWLKSNTGIGDRIHHIVQLLELAEPFGARLVVDMRDGMFGDLDEDVFSKWLECNHPAIWPNPDFDQLLADYRHALDPPEPKYFQAMSFRSFPWTLACSWQQWLMKRETWLNGSPIQKRIRRKIIMLTPFNHLRLKKDWTYLVPIARGIDLRSAPPRIHLTSEIIRKPNWNAERMVWPALKVRKEIESTWSNLGFDASTAVGVHVRQTDKTSSNWWRNLLVQLAAGKVHADCTTVFLATDSLKVQKAFEQAQLSQRLITCPWGALPEDERPIHRSDLPGHWVLKTALYDLWTLAQCKEFIPANGSSFSRLVSAWRSFPPA